LITLSEAVPDDVPAIAELAAEMDRFYGATELDPVEIRRRQIEAALFSGLSARPALCWLGTMASL
jgi:hypothetical protein